MKSEEQSRGQAKGFFHRQWGVLSIRLSMCSSFERDCTSSMNWRAVWRSIFFRYSYISLQDAFDRSSSFDRSS